MPLVELVAVRLADAVHQLHLQRDDGQGGQRLGQQFEGAVEDGGPQDLRVQCRLVDLCRRRGGRRGRQRRRNRHRPRGRGFDGRQHGFHLGIAPQRCVGHGLGLLRELRRRAAGQAQGALEFGQEGLFRPALGAVGVADAHGHLVGQLARLGALQAGHGVGQRDAFHQHVLVQARQFAGLGQPVGDAAHLVALAGVFLAIDEGGHETEGDDAALVLGGHVRAPVGSGKDAEWPQLAAGARLPTRSTSISY